MTEPGLGSSDSAFVDGSRLFWALPSPVHERSGSGSTHPTGYKLMRCLPHTASRPNPGNHVMLLTARANISRSKSLAPGSPRSRPLRAASGGGLRPALTAAAPGAAINHRNERTITSTSRSIPTTEEKACLDRSRLLTTMSPYKPGWSEAQSGETRRRLSSRISRSLSSGAHSATRWLHPGYRIDSEALRHVDQSDRTRPTPLTTRPAS